MPSDRARSAAEPRNATLGAPDSDDAISISCESRSLMPRPRHFITASFAAHRVARRSGSSSASARSAGVQPRSRNAGPPLETSRPILGTDTTSIPTPTTPLRPSASAEAPSTDVSAADGDVAKASTPLTAVFLWTGRVLVASQDDSAPHRPMLHGPPAHRIQRPSVHTRSASGG